MDDLCSMIGIAKHIVEIHKKNSAKKAKNYKLCEEYGNLSYLITIGLPTFYGILIIFYQLPAFIDIFTKGKIRPSASIYLPDVNEADTIDMSVLFLINFVYFTFVANIFLATDAFICIIFLTIPMFSTIIQRQINDTTIYLKDKKKANDSMLIKKQLIDIITTQLEFNA